MTSHAKLTAAMAFALCAMFFACPAFARTYEVGPGKELAAVNDVPWESLQPGDTVLINWRPEAYREKFVIGVSGAREAPITVRGIAGPTGELPVLDGREATSRPGVAFSNENRSVISLGGLKPMAAAASPTAGEVTPSEAQAAQADKEVVPTNIVIENLEIRSARPPYTFCNSKGEKETYDQSASSVRFMISDGATLRNCIIRDSSMGIISSGRTTRNLTIEGCLFVDNGLEDQVWVHQSYLSSDRIVYQYNHYAPLRKGCTGSNLKDRSAGNVVRYNWIDGGNKQMDFPDGGFQSLFSYRQTFVYGNVLIKLADVPKGAEREMVTYGGDMGDTARYRKGTLYFYNNTCVSYRPDQTTIFKIKTIDENCDARNNIFYTAAAGHTLALMGWEGTLNLTHNWIKTGWVNTHAGDEYHGIISDDGTSVTGDAPGFVDFAAQDLHLAKDSPCVDAGSVLNARAMIDNTVTRQYVKHQSSEPRPDDGRIDIGAFEYVKSSTK